MAHEVLDGHRAAWRNEIERDLAFGILLLFPDHHMLERRDVLGYRVVKGEPSVFKQHHCRHCGDRLGHGIKAKDSVFRHWDLLLRLKASDSLEVPNLPLARDHENGAWDYTLIDVRLQGFGDHLEAL